MSGAYKREWRSNLCINTMLFWPTYHNRSVLFLNYCLKLLFYKRNKTQLPCLHRLMKTSVGLGEISSGHKYSAFGLVYYLLSFSPKRTSVCIYSLCKHGSCVLFLNDSWYKTSIIQPPNLRDFCMGKYISLTPGPWTITMDTKMDYQNGLLNGLPKWTTLNYLPRKIKIK